MKVKNRYSAKRVKRRVKGHAASGGDRTNEVVSAVRRVMQTGRRGYRG